MYCRVRDIGTINLDEVTPIEAIDIETKKPVTFKQYDLGSTILFDLDVDYNTDGVQDGSEKFIVTFKKVNKETFASELIKTTDGEPVCVLCGVVDDYRLELKPPAEVMDVVGKYSFEIVFVDADGYRITSKAISFTVIESIMAYDFSIGE